MKTGFNITQLKTPPEGITIKTIGDSIEVLASKRDYDFLIFQIFLLLFPFGLMYVIVGFNFDLFTILCYLLFFILAVWWIASNLLANFRLLITNGNLQLFEGMNQGTLIYSLNFDQIKDVKINSERSVRAFGWYKGTTLYLSELVVDLKDDRSFVVGKTLMNKHKHYINYFLDHYIKEYKL